MIHKKPTFSVQFEFRPEAAPSLFHLIMVYHEEHEEHEVKKEVHGSGSKSSENADVHP
jgi:hypothetical protein